MRSGDDSENSSSRACAPIDRKPRSNSSRAPSLPAWRANQLGSGGARPDQGEHAEQPRNFRQVRASVDLNTGSSQCDQENAERDDEEPCEMVPIRALADRLIVRV